MSDDAPSLESFSGVARLFPLPNLVLFPSVVQPLHIFEPRYRQMMADALDDDRLLALVLLQPGWEEDYHTRPPIYPVAVLGRVFNEELLADGRYNLLLHGLTRIRILEELPPDKMYREARVELLEDVPLASTAEEAALRDRLRQVMPPLLKDQGGAVEQALKLLESDELTMGMLCDIFTFAMPLDFGFKQQLLEELDVGRRTRALIAQLETMLPQEKGQRRFPPKFSEN